MSSSLVLKKERDRRSEFCSASSVQQSGFEQIAVHYPVTSTDIESRGIPLVMLGVCSGRLRASRSLPALGLMAVMQ
jgi:hypothetical protein